MKILFYAVIVLGAVSCVAYIGFEFTNLIHQDVSRFEPHTK